MPIKYTQEWLKANVFSRPVEERRLINLAVSGSWPGVVLEHAEALMAKEVEELKKDDTDAKA